MPVLLGVAYIDFTRYDGGSLPGVQQRYYLRVPLQQRSAQHRRRRIVSESWDYSKRVVTVVGSGVSELRGVVRYDENPVVLMDMLIAGADGGVLVYFNGQNPVQTEMIEPSGDLIAIAREEESLPDFEFSAELVLRVIGGTNAASLVQGAYGY